MYITHVDKVEEFEVKAPNTRGMKVKYLLHAGVGSKKVQLRLFTIGPGGGHVEDDVHAHEHQIYVLEGEGFVVSGGRRERVRPGSVVFIPSMEPHRIVNDGDKPLKILCIKLTSEVPPPLRGRAKEG